jgi:hypothetical protein
MSILGTIGAVGAVAGAGIGAVGANAAAGTQASASENAAQLQAQESQQALAQNESQFNVNQANAAPFLKGGTQAEGELSGLTSTPGQGLLTPWTGTFQAPTAAQAAATPGEQFELQQGENAIQNSAASKGGLLSGGTAASLDQFANGVASTNYQQAYNNAYQGYATGYNQFENNQANQYNRLAGLAGAGQTEVTNLGSQGQASANTAANIDLTTGAQQGQDIQNAGAATASGYAGIANAANSGISGASNSLQQTLLLQQLLGGGSGSGLTSADVSGAGMF